MEQYFGENVSIFPLVVVNSEKLLCRHSGPVVNEFVFISRQVNIENQGYLLGCISNKKESSDRIVI